MFYETIVTRDLMGLRSICSNHNMLVPTAFRIATLPGGNGSRIRHLTFVSFLFPVDTQEINHPQMHILVASCSHSNLSSLVLCSITGPTKRERVNGPSCRLPIPSLGGNVFPSISRRRFSFTGRELLPTREVQDGLLVLV